VAFVTLALPQRVYSLRRDNLRQLWSRYGRYVIAAAVLVLVVVVEELVVVLEELVLVLELVVDELLEVVVAGPRASR